MFWEEMRREISFMFQLSISFVLDVSANIIKIETNKPSVEIQHMQDIDIYIYNSHDGHTLYLHCWQLKETHVLYSNENGEQKVTHMCLL